MSTLAHAIDAAALCKQPDGKRQSHQRRIPRLTLEESRQRLREMLPALRTVRSFGELYDIVGSTIRDIPGIGELTVYDTAVCIGWHLDIHPTEVYLHRGTRAGAKELDFNGSQQTVRVDELPAGLRILTPGEIEDVLCIYKDAMASIRVGLDPELSPSTGCQPEARRRTC
ncbi:hypothetical protein [Catenulispora rubra]|uniref:hypothetical protein n=1 Tax=Catenulispora rubra TaxID=280293 RepID=UPI001892485D|nr:hypothetical protein [Catenulispora rubra]